MSRRIYISGGVLLLMTAACAWLYVEPRQPVHVAASAPPRPTAQSAALASPGRIEGRSETVLVGAAADGLIQSVEVAQGQSVKRGDILARLACADLYAEMRAASAEAESMRQARARLLRGSREEQRQVAVQRTASARAVLEQATTHLERMSKLHASAAVSRSVLDSARRDHDVAAAELKRAMRDEELVNATALPEEIARADADIQAAEQRSGVAQDRAAKCAVRAPIDGTVLRVHMRVGELYSRFAPQPILSLADVSTRRVRAEVDEQDVGRVRMGQKVIVSSDAYPGKRFSGMVSRLSSMMGRKSVITGHPSEKSDRDILEVLADLNPDAMALPVGLRVTVQFLN